jgi:hypothetical protein
LAYYWHSELVPNFPEASGNLAATHLSRSRLLGLVDLLAPIFRVIDWGPLSAVCFTEQLLQCSFPKTDVVILGQITLQPTDQFEHFPAFGPAIISR